MKCTEANEMMMDFFDNELNDFENYSLKKHLKGCLKCADEFRALSDITQYFEDQPLLEPNENFEYCVMEKINTSKKEWQHNVRWNPLVIIFSVFCSVIFILAAWAFVFFDSITLIQLISSTAGSELAPKYVTEIQTFFSERLRMAILIGNSVLDIYNILFRNYFHILISVASVFIIISSTRFGLVRQHR